MLDALKGLVGSKKALATLAGMIVAAVAKFGFDAPADFVYGLLGLVSAYVVGQGAADWGKEAAAIKKAASDKS